MNRTAINWSEINAGAVAVDVAADVAVEADSALTISPVAVVLVATAVEADSALGPAPAARVGVLTADEADSALGLTPVAVVAIAQAVEGSTALSVSTVAVVQVQHAEEADTALVVSVASVVQVVTVVIAAEADSALTVRPYTYAASRLAVVVSSSRVVLIPRSDSDERTAVVAHEARTVVVR